MSPTPAAASDTLCSTPALQLRLGLGALVASIVLAMTLVPAVQASAASAQGETTAAAAKGVAAAVQGLQVFTNGPFAADR